MMAHGRGDYPGDYYRLVITGLVDHEWAARLYNASHLKNRADAASELAEVLAERHFHYSEELLKALTDLDWESLRAVAKTMDAEGLMKIEMIC